MGNRILTEKYINNFNLDKYKVIDSDSSSDIEVSTEKKK